MFTGIIQSKVAIAWISHNPTFTRYALIFPTELLTDLVIGASVSVQGICQTVVAIENNIVTFEAIAETLAVTTLPTWEKGNFVNIERSLRMGNEIGGHLVSGHIIGTGEIKAIDYPSKEQAILTISCPFEWMKYIFPKGYIALNGASLTVGKTEKSGEFTVNLIPETRNITTFSDANITNKVNIEIDSQTQTIVDTVERILHHSLSSGGSSLGL